MFEELASVEAKNKKTKKKQNKAKQKLIIPEAEGAESLRELNVTEQSWRRS